MRFVHVMRFMRFMPFMQGMRPSIRWMGWGLACAGAFFSYPTAFCADSTCVLRVESEIFVGDNKQPVARSLTLFRNGIAWDFLEQPAGIAAGDNAKDANRSDTLSSNPSDEPAQTDSSQMVLQEIVLHDPARDRVVIIDPKRNVKTQIEAIRLERLSVSLASWARKADDRLVRWAAGPDFGDGIQEKGSSLVLVGPRVRYAVDFAAAPSGDTSAIYSRFADTAILLKALLHPGGLPPFPRLAINRRVSAAGGIPTTVTLEIDLKSALLGGHSDVVRSVHKAHPQLLAGDLDRIEEAESQVAVAEPVELAAFVAPSSGASAKQND